MRHKLETCQKIERALREHYVAPLWDGDLLQHTKAHVTIEVVAFAFDGDSYFSQLHTNSQRD
jgi:hypothetical protein